jgi:hypothetical protein
MRPPERYSVSPLPSFATRIPFSPPPVPFSIQVANVIRWLRHARPGEGERRLADGIVKRMIAEIEIEEGEQQ